MKVTKYTNMSNDELASQLKELKEELFNLRFQMATGQLHNPVSIRETRRNIARVMTVQRQRELNQAKA